MAEKYIAKSSAIAARMLAGEMMVMSITDSTFFTLNEVASVIWQAADGCTPLSEIVTDKICRESMSIASAPSAKPSASSTNSHSTASCWYRINR